MYAPYAFLDLHLHTLSSELSFLHDAHSVIGDLCAYRVDLGSDRTTLPLEEHPDRGEHDSEPR